MSEIKGLPLKFKLFLEGHFKGYLEYVPKIKISWLQTDEVLLFPFFYFDPKRKSLIRQSFDEMRQFTGHYDRHGEEIYFGDRLRSDHYRKEVFTVGLYGGSIKAKDEVGDFPYMLEFDSISKMEVIHD